MKIKERENGNYSQNNPQPNDPIVDLLALTQQPVNYECESCEVALIPFPQLKQSNPFAGEGYICPECGAVTDSSLTAMKGQVKVEPVDVGSPTDILETIPETSGFTIETDNDYDPEPQEEERLKAIGAKIISKRVEVSKD